MTEHSRLRHSPDSEAGLRVVCMTSDAATRTSTTNASDEATSGTASTGKPNDVAAGRAPFTLRSAAGLPADPQPLADSVLVIIDAQEEYGVDGALPLPGLALALERDVVLLNRARTLGSPVIHVVHQGAAGGLFDPDRGGRVLAAVAPLSGESIVTKGLPNAFAGTDLADRIDKLGRPPVVIVGFMTHMCVSSTARAALDLGLSTTVVSDATATRSLPDAAGGAAISADVVHRSALAALADRFSVIAATSALVPG